MREHIAPPCCGRSIARPRVRGVVKFARHTQVLPAVLCLVRPNGPLRLRSI